MAVTPKENWSRANKWGCTEISKAKAAWAARTSERSLALQVTIPKMTLTLNYFDSKDTSRVPLLRWQQAQSRQFGTSHVTQQSPRPWLDAPWGRPLQPNPTPGHFPPILGMLFQGTHLPVRLFPESWNSPHPSLCYHRPPFGQSCHQFYSFITQLSTRFSTTSYEFQLLCRTCQ